MTDYKTLYYTLFNRLTDVIEELKEIQSQMEEMYINDGISDNSKNIHIIKKGE